MANNKESDSTHKLVKYISEHNPEYASKETAVGFIRDARRIMRSDVWVWGLINDLYLKQIKFPEDEEK